ISSYHQKQTHVRRVGRHGERTHVLRDRRPRPCHTRGIKRLGANPLGTPRSSYGFHRTANARLRLRWPSRIPFDRSAQKVDSKELEFRSISLPKMNENLTND